MFIKQLKQILNFTKDKKDGTVGKVDKGLNYITTKISRGILESKVIVEKLKDLHKTNYSLGLEHLKKGNLREATFRFKIVRKFWPEDKNAHLNLIYCYFITNNEERVNQAIEELLMLDNSLKPAIEELRIDASFYVNPQDNQNDK